MSLFRTLSAGVAVAVVTALAVAAPASAHDELLSSTPSSGQVFVAAPAEVTLSFSAEVLAMGAIVVVADAEGRDWVLGEPALDGSVVTATIDPAITVAGYEVRWRVVSSDGHPISGVIPFTIGDALALERDAGSSGAGAGAGDVGAGADVDADAGIETSATNTGGPANIAALARVITIGALGAALAAAVFALIVFLRRRATVPGAGSADR